MPDDGSLNQNK